MFEKKILTLFMGLAIVLPVFAPAQEYNDPESVWFSAETPYLAEISRILEQNDLTLALDSLSAAYRGECLIYTAGDSLSCDVIIRRDDAATRVLGSFKKEQLSASDVRDSVTSFGIWLLILNAISAILFFVRF